MHVAVTIAVTLIRNRECFLPIAVSIPGFDARRSYDRSYAIGNRECLLHIAVT